MKKIFLTFAFVLLTAMTITAQEAGKPNGKRAFSPEEFKEKQKAYITEKAELTAEEADAFFPLFFELQKKKFGIEHGARKEVKWKRGEKMTEEQCRELAYGMADAKIEIAKLEREYTDKYLQVLSACKLNKVQRAENSFQRDLMKSMFKDRNHRKRPTQETD